MSKTKSTILLSLLLAVIMFVSVFTFLPETKMGLKIYHSPLDLLIKGSDIDSGAYVVYSFDRPKDITDSEYTQQIADTVKVMRARLDNFGFYDADISYSEGNITVTYPDSGDTASITALVGQKGYFRLSTSSTYTDLEKMITNSEHLVSAKKLFVSSSNTYYVEITMDDEALASFKKATATAATTAVTVYFLLDGSTYNSQSIDYTFTTNKMYMSTTTEIAADTLTSMINNGYYQFELTQVKTGLVNPSATTPSVWLFIILAVLVLAVIVAFVISYGLFGLSSGIALICFVLMQIIAGGLIYANEFSLGALAAFIVGIAFFVIINVVLLEKIKTQCAVINESDSTKRLIIALGRGNKAILMPVIESHIIALLCSVLVWIFAKGAIIPVATFITYAIAASAVCVLLITRIFNRLFISACPKCYKKYLNTAEEVK